MSPFPPGKTNATWNRRPWCFSFNSISVSCINQSATDTLSRESGMQALAFNFIGEPRLFEIGQTIGNEAARLTLFQEFAWNFYAMLRNHPQFFRCQRIGRRRKKDGVGIKGRFIEIARFENASSQNALKHAPDGALKCSHFKRITGTKAHAQDKECRSAGKKTSITSNRCLYV